MGVATQSTATGPNRVQSVANAPADHVSDLSPSALPGAGTANDPYRISNASELQAMQDDLDAHYVLVSDIDASGTQHWNNGSGFRPIGSGFSSSAPFTGSFDGQFHTVRGLHINRSNRYYVGLFGSMEGRVSNVSLENVSIRGDVFVGSVAGHNGGTIAQSRATGRVAGNTPVGGLVGRSFGTVQEAGAVATVTGSIEVGGLIGHNSGSVTNVYARGSRTAGSEVGGLIGLHTGGSLTHAYAAGTISGTADVGGLVGWHEAGTVGDAYWDTDTTGVQAPIGTTGGRPERVTQERLTGRTTGAMTGVDAPQNLSRLAFGDVWSARETAYPGLVWEHQLRSDDPATPQPTVLVDGEADGDSEYATIQSAIENASEGSVVSVAPGTYREAVTISANITLAAPQGATLNGSTISGSGITIQRDSHAAPTISGFTITNYSDQGIDAGFTAGDWVVRNSTITHTTSNGIYAAETSGDWRLENVALEDAGPRALKATGSTGNWTAENLTLTGSLRAGVAAVDTTGNWTLRYASISGIGAGPGVDATNASGAWTIVDSAITTSSVGVAAGSSDGNWTVGDTQLSSNEVGLDATAATSDWLLVNAAVTGNEVGVKAMQTTGDWTIAKTTITTNDGDWQTAGVGLTADQARGNWTVWNATIADNDQTGIRATNTSGHWQVQESIITGHTETGVNATGATHAGNATYNYWGAPDGPSGDYSGSGDPVVGNVSIEPFYPTAARDAATTPETSISTCGVIDQPGVYTLTADIARDVTDHCLNITASNVVLDGQGHLIDGRAVHNTDTAVYATGVSNITIRNLRVTNNDYGIRLVGVTNATLRNVSGFGTTDNGIYLQSTANVTVTDSRFADTTVGVSVLGSSQVSITDTHVTETDAGVELWGRTTQTHITNTTITDSTTGISILPYAGEPPTETTIANTTITRSETGVDLWSRGDTRPATATRVLNTTINTTTGAAVRTEDGARLALQDVHLVSGAITTTIQSGVAQNVDAGVISPRDAPRLPDATRRATGILNLTNTTGVGSLNASIAYEPPTDATATVGLWTVTAGSWTQHPAATTTPSTVTANLTAPTTATVLIEPTTTSVVDGDQDGDREYATIQAAVDNASAGDTIEVRPGTYREQVTVETPISLVAPQGAVLNGSTLGNEYYVAALRLQAPAVVSGFTITHYPTGIGGAEYGSDWRVQDTTLQDNGFGVRTPFSRGNWTIHNTTLTGNAVGVNAYWSSGNWTITNTTITNTTPHVNFTPHHGVAGTGVYAVATKDHWTIHNSSLTQNDAADINATDAETRGTATHNYWGTSGADCVGNVTCEQPLSTPPGTGTDAPPTASVSIADHSLRVGEPVQVDASGSSDDRGITSYTWTFGDGTTAYGETASHAYSSAGDYTITLTVTDTAGNTATTTRTVSVTATAGGGGPSGPGSGTPGIASFENTTALQPPQATPSSLAGVVRGETGTAANLSIELVRSTTWNYSLAITGPDTATNTTIYLQTQAISASANISNLTMYLNDSRHTYTVAESAGPGGSQWVAFNIPHFSTQTVSFTSTNLSLQSVSLSETTISTGESVTVEAVVANTGTEPASGNITLTVDGSPVATKPVSLDPDATTTVTFDRPFTSSGTYELAINNQTAGTVTVEPASTSTTTPGFGPVIALLALLVGAGVIRYRT